MPHWYDTQVDNIHFTEKTAVIRYISDTEAQSFTVTNYTRHLVVHFAIQKQEKATYVI